MSVCVSGVQQWAVTIHFDGCCAAAWLYSSVSSPQQHQQGSNTLS